MRRSVCEMIELAGGVIIRIELHWEEVVASPCEVEAIRPSGICQHAEVLAAGADAPSMALEHAFGYQR